MSKKFSASNSNLIPPGSLRARWWRGQRERDHISALIQEAIETIAAENDMHSSYGIRTQNLNLTRCRKRVIPRKRG